MCAYDDSDPVTMLGESNPKARKPHKCAECGRTIEPGETYRLERFVFDGKMSAHKTCSHCLAARNWLGAECGGWIFGGVANDLREHVQEGGYGMDLARMAVAIDHGWARRDGSLRPVPQPLKAGEVPGSQEGG